MTEKPYKDEDWLRTKYHDEEMAMAEMGELVDKTASTIQYWMEKLDVETKKRGYRPDNPEPYRDAGWLRRKHHDENMSLYAIADACGCSHTCIHRWMEWLGVKKRDKSEAATLRAGQHPHTIPSGEDHHFWKPPEERQDFYHSGKWRKVRKQVYKRDGHECTECGASECELHAHHLERPINGGPKFDLDNLVTLCRDCHMNRHL